MAACMQWCQHKYLEVFNLWRFPFQFYILYRGQMSLIQEQVDHLRYQMKQQVWICTNSYMKESDFGKGWKLSEDL